MFRLANGELRAPVLKRLTTGQNLDGINNNRISFILSDGVDDVVDLEDGPDRLRGEVERRGGDEQRLHDVLVEDVGDGALPHVDAAHGLALGVE